MAGVDDYHVSVSSQDEMEQAFIEQIWEEVREATKQKKDRLQRYKKVNEKTK